MGVNVLTRVLCLREQESCAIAGEPRDATVNLDTYRSLQLPGFHCDNTAFCLKSRKITLLNMSIYCVSAIQGHPRSLILVRIESEYATSY